jgi:hypothetical protein
MKQMMNMVILLTCVISSLSAQDNQKIFYDSNKFFQRVQNDPSLDDSTLAEVILQRFTNDRVFPVTDSEFKIFTDGPLSLNSNLSDTLETFFHIMTKYGYFDYSKYNQFEERRLKSKHQKNLSIFKHDNNQLYRVSHRISGEELGKYDFDKNYFTFRLPKEHLAETKLINHVNGKKLPDNYEGNTYRLNYIPINIPQKLKIYFNDPNMAEKQSTNEFDVQYIFTLTEVVNEYKSFIDIPSSTLELYEGELYRMGSIGGDWSKWEQYVALSKAQKIQQFYNFCRDSNYSEISPYGRRYFHSVQLKLVAVAIESSIMGKALWKAADWYHAIDDSTLKKFNTDIKQQDYAEIEQLSKVMWDLNRVLYEGPYWIYLDKSEKDNNPSIKYKTSKIIKIEEELVGTLNRLTFTNSRLKDLANRYRKGLLRHLVRNQYFYDELKNERVNKYNELLNIKGGSRKYGGERNRNARDKFLHEYGKLYFDIWNDYIEPVEVEFGDFLKENYPERFDLAWPASQCLHDANTLGLFIDPNYPPELLGLGNAKYHNSRAIDVNIDDFKYGVTLLEVDGKLIKSICDYNTAVQNKEKGDVITITYNSKNLSGNQYIQLVVQ